MDKYLEDLINSIPDSEFPSETDIFKQVGDKVIYVECWCDRCFSNQDLNSREKMVEYARNATHNLLNNQPNLPQNKILNGYELVDYKFIEFPDNEVNYCASIGIYKYKMEYYVTYLKDILGSNYLGINIPEAIVEPFLEKFKNTIGDEYQKFIKNQKDRDKGKYHITVISVRDYGKLSKEMGISSFINSLELILKYPIDDLEMLGVGSASKNDNLAYFIVCNSEKLDAIRTRFNLPKQDFHITIGFDPKDVSNVPKNVVVIK